MLGAETETEKVQGFGAALAKVATIGAVVVGALKTVTMAAWSFADSYVRRAEELYNSNDSLVKITKEQVEMSKKYQDGMGKLGDIIESVKTQIAFGFLPTMLRMVETYNEFLDANKDLIANGIQKLMNVISYANQVLSNTVRFITKLIEKTIGWKGALIVLIGVFAWLKRAMILAFITNPITWVIAAIVGLMLIIDDFMTYLDGGESQFGEFWGAMLGWIKDNEDALKGIWDTLVYGMSLLIEFGAFFATYFGGALIDTVKLVVAILMYLYAVFTGNTELMAAAWDGMVENLLSIFRNFASLFEPLAQMLLKIMSKVWDMIVSYVASRINSILTNVRNFVTTLGNILSNVFNIMTAPFEKAFDWISDKFGSLSSMVGNTVSGIGKVFSMGSSAATSSTINNGGNTIINAPISVSANDANKAAVMAGKQLTGVANAAHRNTSSRVIA